MAQSLCRGFQVRGRRMREMKSQNAPNVETGISYPALATSNKLRLTGNLVVMMGRYVLTRLCTGGRTIGYPQWINQPGP
jgi:hypothetical protein